MLGHSRISNRSKVLKKQLLEDLKSICKNCASCELHKTRNNIVFADGNPETAKIILIGEAPGENEDLQGKPFVGIGGKLLNQFLEEAGISREKDLYIINTVKCRPPKNRVPTKEEKATCKHFLIEQISIINPKLILLCGTTAMSDFIEKVKITDVHGKIFEINIEDKTYKAMPILHPSPLCRFKDKKTVMVNDLIKAKSLI